MSNRKVEDIVNELKAAREAASVNLQDIPFAIRPGRAIQKETARAKIEPLRKELLAATVPGRLVGILASGDLNKQADVSAFLTKNDGITLAADRFWQGVADLVEPSYGVERIFRTTQHGLLMQALSDAATAQGFSIVEAPKFVQAVCPTRVDTVAHIRKVMTTVGGERLAQFFMEADILGAVVENNLFDKKIPVLVIGSSEEEHPFLRRLFARAVPFEFTPEFEVTKEAITKILKQAV